MQRVAASVLAVISLLLHTQHEPPSADFGFRIEFGACVTDVFDTFQALYTRDMGPGAAAISISVALPRESRELAFQAVMDARFFDQPSRLQLEPISEPIYRYRLVVRNNGIEHTVTWAGGFDPVTAQATGLTKAAVTIIRLITALPAVQHLPKPDLICI